MDTKVQTPSKITIITPPRMEVGHYTISGLAPLMIAKFSSKARLKEATQMAGGVAKSKKNREARDFSADVEGARHISMEGWDGISAAAFRNAMIDACRAAGYVMTKAKLSVFAEADGTDREDGTPLIRILSDAPFEPSRMAVRNATGVMDIRARPMWRQWSMLVRIRFDADMLSLDDITNLLMRVGLQVGVGEGRPFGREGTGLGFGLFEIKSITHERSN